ncbi:MAG: hypothetical protein B6I22_11010 [Desulfobacteraceae bacterium 4572_123]|nr:MAG: hypothetical protein B6I22_11010 [Desulfobacteraceae bacterium 4572_123]
MAEKPTYEELENKLKALEKKMGDRSRVGAALQKRMHDLDERVKELNCLYGISHIVEQNNISLEQVAQGAVDLIVAATQYPERTCARIILRGREFKTKNFKKTKWKQISKIIVQGRMIGAVEVYYLVKKPASDKGPFLKEERALLNVVAGRLGRIAEWMRTEKEIRLLKEKYEDLYNNAPVMYLSLDHNGIVVECNNTILDKLKYTRSEFIGKHMINFVTPKSAAAFKMTFPELVETGKIFGAERQLVTKNGKIIDTILNATVEYDENGKPVKTRSTFEDISKRKRTEETLRKSEKIYHTLLETTSEGCWRINPDLKTVEVNRSLCKMLGYRPNEMLGKTPFDFVDDDNRKIFLEQTSKISTTRHRSYEITLKKKNGEDLQTYFNSSTIRDKSDKVAGAFAFITEITERKRMEEALYTSETQKQTILDASIDRIRLVDRDMKIIWANQTTAAVHGISPKDMEGQVCYKLFIGRETPCEGCPNVKALETEKIERAVMHQPRVSGIKGESFWDTYIVPLKNKAGDIESFIQVARNITDQVQAEKHIRDLTQQLMKAQETERQRIARELHDNVAQDLSLLKIGCETLFDGQPSIPVEIGQKIASYSEIFQKTITAVRDMAYNIHPPGLDELGFLPAVYQYCENFSEKTGIYVDFRAAGMDTLNLNFDTKINLYRIIQEALNNINKHADTNRSMIRLVAAWPNIILRIEDDGSGFDKELRMKTAIVEKRMGIRSIKERAALLDGKMTIQSRPMQGTKILIKIPCKEEKK